MLQKLKFAPGFNKQVTAVSSVGSSPSQTTLADHFRKYIMKNIDIALSLDTIKTIYMINHQDCGAIKAYLECSGYPETLGENNEKDIKINTQILLIAEKYIKCKYPNIKPRLGLIDINGTVANLVDGKWFVIYKGPGTNPLGLWYNY